MRVTIKGTGRTITLTDRNFKAAGGEGAVYVEGDLAIKIYEDHSKMIPEGKISELSMIATERILAPTHVVLRGDLPIGYAMKSAEGCLPLPKIYPRSWREANGLTPDVAMDLVLGLRKSVEHVHRNGCLIVDLNEMNFLARADFSALLHIDVDSYQTPSYPATAIMPSIRDPFAIKFSEGSDWYSFGIVAFSILVGIHPFKGTHPSYKRGALTERMKDGVSALDAEVRLPAPVMPLDVIPKGWKVWFEGVFHAKDRTPPPLDAVVARVVMPVRVATMVGDVVRLKMVWEAKDGQRIANVLRVGSGFLILLSDGSFVRTDNGAVVGTFSSDLPNGLPSAIGITSKLSKPVAFWKSDSVGWYQGYDLGAGERLSSNLRADELISCGYGMVHARLGEALMEVRYFEGASTSAHLHQVGSVAPQAVTMLPGVAIQSLLGATYASILPKPGRCVQVRLKEIEGQRVVDGRFVGGRGVEGRSGVLMVVVENRGRMDLHRWSGLYSTGKFEMYQIEEDVQTFDLNLVELDTGVCVEVKEDGSLELYRPGTDKTQRVVDQAIAGGRLYHDGGRLLVAIEGSLYEAKMAK